jgi:hypothetical protein
MEPGTATTACALTGASAREGEEKRPPGTPAPARPCDLPDAALGVTLVNRSDHRTVEALRSWGWRYNEGDTPRTALLGPFRVLVPET